MAPLPLLATESDKVLERLRAMPESDLRAKVIVPLLKAIGATNVQDTHGAFERGKDLLYTIKDAYDDLRLEVCQVKNDKFTGKAGTEGNTMAVVQQLHQCRITEVFNPSTNRKQLPQAVVLITTYPLPEKDTADGDSIFKELEKLQCKIIGPEKVVGLLKDRLPELYAEIAFPGDELMRAIRRYVEVHHEAHAFDVSRPRHLVDFYINLGITHATGPLDRIARGALMAKSSVSITLELQQYQWLEAFREVLEHHTGPITLLEREPYKPAVSIPSAPEASSPPTSAAAPEQPANSANISRKASGQGDRVRLAKVHFKEMLGTVAGHVGKIRQQSQQPGCSPDQLEPTTAKAIRLLACCDALTAELVEAIDDLVRPMKPNQRIRHYDFGLTDVPPGVLLSMGGNVAILGDAGAGKTSLARKLAIEALERGEKCIYFPCSKIEDYKTSLKTGIVKFLRTLGSGQNDKAAKQLLKNASLIILDGCDEAASFGPRLLAEIEGLAFAGPFRESVPLSSSGAVPKNVGKPIIPPALRKHVSYDESERMLTLEQPLSEWELAYLLSVNRESGFEGPLRRLSERSRKESPRVYVTSGPSIFI